MTLALLLALTMVLAQPVRRLKRRPLPGDAEFFATVAAELRRGASLRHAIAWAAPGSNAARLAMTGQPMAAVVTALQVDVPLRGELAAAGMNLAARSGAPAAPLFHRLVDRSQAGRQLARELRVLTAQARLSAAVVGLIPLLTSCVLVVGRGGVLASPAARIVVGAGLGLQLLGLAVVAVLLRMH